MGNRMMNEDEFSEKIKELIKLEHKSSYISGLSMGFLILNAVNLLAILTVYLIRFLK